MCLSVLLGNGDWIAPFAATGCNGGFQSGATAAKTAAMTLSTERPGTANRTAPSLLNGNSNATISKPAALPSQINSLLARLRQPAPAQEHARHKLLAGEFLAP